MKVIKIVVNCIIAFILCLLILADFTVILVSDTLIEEEYMLSILEKNNYYEKIQIDLKNGFEEYKYQSGLPEEIFENLYTEEMIKADINSIFDGIFKGTKVTNSSKEVESRIINNINEYLSENSIRLTDLEQKNVDTFQNLIVKKYEEKVNISDKHIQKISNLKNKADKIINIAKICLITMTAIIFIILLLMNIKDKIYFLYFTAISVLASGIVLNLVSLVINKNIDINSILLLTQTISDFVKDIIYDILFKFNSFGIGFIITGLVGMLLSSYIKSKKADF